MHFKRFFDNTTERKKISKIWDTVFTTPLLVEANLSSSTCCAWLSRYRAGYEGFFNQKWNEFLKIIIWHNKKQEQAIFRFSLFYIWSGLILKHNYISNVFTFAMLTETKIIIAGVDVRKTLFKTTNWVRCHCTSRYLFETCTYSKTKASCFFCKAVIWFWKAWSKKLQTEILL